MKSNVFVLLLTQCYFTFGALPYGQKEPDGKLIGGHSTNPLHHPYLVSLQTRFFMIRVHVCGGTLLNENWFETVYSRGGLIVTKSGSDDGILDKSRELLEFCGHAYGDFSMFKNNTCICSRKAPCGEVKMINTRTDHRSYVQAEAARDNILWILSAAHCVRESFIVKWLPMEAIAGSSNAHSTQSFGPDAQIAAVDRRIPHPDYAGGIGPNDVAVLRTSRPFRFTKFVQPATLPSAMKATYESSLVLSGWGILKTTFFFPDLPRHLQEVNVTYLPHKECYEAVEAIKDSGERNPLDEKSNICTGPLSGGISACSGDSGGPLIQYIKKQENAIDDNENNVIDDTYPLTLPEDRKMGNKYDEIIPVVVGVVSWGSSPCGEKGAPTVYTKVESFVDFINTYVR